MRYLIKNDNGYVLTELGYALIVILFIVLIFVLLFISAKMNSNRVFDVKKLAFCAMSISLATATSMFKIINFPFGGSITFFSMLCICLTGYFYGLGAGITSGMAFGIIQFILNPYILFPVQVILDYIFAYASLGLAGIFSRSKHGLVKGYIIGVLGRYFFTVLSGWIFFREYAWKGWGVLTYSLVYNGIYIFAEAILTISIICIPTVSKAIDRIKSLVF